MIDFHNHILPGVDDGPETITETIHMLQTAVEQGIRHVVNTVHYQHPKLDSKEIVTEIVHSKMDEVKKAMQEHQIDLSLSLGAEVFYLPNLIELSEDPLITIGKGKYLLVEFPFHMVPEGQGEILFHLKMKGITPIIAHPERYRVVQQDLEIVNNWVRGGCLIQMDGGSLLKSFGSSAKQCAEEILKARLCHVIGSDVHNDRRRNFCLKEAVAAGREIIGDQVIDLVTTFPEKIIQGESLEIEVEDMFIPYSTPTFLEKVRRRFATLWK